MVSSAGALGRYAGCSAYLDESWRIIKNDNPDCNNISYVKVWFGQSTDNVQTAWFDGFRFDAHVIRGTYRTGVSLTKVKTITDDVGKDDSGLASDDTGTIARLAYAELLRAAAQPTTGKIIIPA